MQQAGGDVAAGAAAAAAAQPLEPAPAEEAGAHSWTVHDWSRVQDTLLLSEDFTLARRKWRLMLYPRGNTDRGTHLSLFLDSFPETGGGLRPGESCEFTLVLHSDSGAGVCKGTSHRFRPEQPDWGYNKFVTLESLLDPARGFLVDDALTVSVEELRITRS